MPVRQVWMRQACTALTRERRAEQGAHRFGASSARVKRSNKPPGETNRKASLEDEARGEALEDVGRSARRCTQ